MQRSPEDPSAIPSTSGGGGGAWEIEEEQEELHSEYANGPSRVAPTSKPKFVDEDDVYVAVGKGSSSMDALSWALRNVAKPTGFVYLVHVFPEVHHIPTPLGMMPKAQLSQAQVDSYMEQEKMKRREMLQKFIKLCQTSKMEVDTFLIESDQIAKAIVDLIPVLNIKRLIVGTSKSNLRKRIKGSSKAAQIQQNAPSFCEVKVISGGKEITVTVGTPTPDRTTPSSPTSYTAATADNGNLSDGQTEDRSDGILFCRCFTGKFL